MPPVLVAAAAASEPQAPVAHEPSPVRAFEPPLRDDAPVVPSFVAAPPAPIAVDLPPADPPRAFPSHPDVPEESEPTPIAFVASVIQAEMPAVPRNAPPIQAVSRELPPDSGLVLVETRSTGTSASEEVDMAATKPRRVRPPRAEITAEPLEMVETQKEPPPSA